MDNCSPGAAAARLRDNTLASCIPGMHGTQDADECCPHREIHTRRPGNWRSRRVCDKMR
jgi:hypothetical protein